MKAHKKEVQRMSDSHGERITRLEVTQEHIFQALVDIKSELKEFRNEINNRIDRVESRIDRLGGRMWTLHFWNMASFVTVLGVIAHGFKWI
jgi:hypothetical protein